jgi:hypothetical protein
MRPKSKQRSRPGHECRSTRRSSELWPQRGAKAVHLESRLFRALISAACGAPVNGTFENKDRAVDLRAQHRGAAMAAWGAFLAAANLCASLRPILRLFFTR